MAVNNFLGARAMTGLEAVPQRNVQPAYGGGILRRWFDTVSMTASDPNSTALLARLPSSARVWEMLLAFDDIGAATTTVHLGAFNPTYHTKARFTDDNDIFGASIAVASAGTYTFPVAASAHENRGKLLWEHMGLSADPKCDVDIKVTVNVAATDATGDVSLMITYSFD